MKSSAKTQLGFSLAGWLALLLAATPAHAANLLVGGYSLSTYASGLPVDNQISGMTIDPATRQIFYMGANTNGPLRRLDPGGAVTTLGTESPGTGFYPFIATDIEYYNGNVFTCDSNGNLIKYSATVAGYSTLVTLAGFGLESGITRVGSTLYVSSGGTGAPGIILTADPVSALINFPNLPAPISASSLEYDSVHNRLIVASMNGGGFYTIDLGTKTLGSVFGAGVSGFENFCVDPTGTSIFTRSFGTVLQIDIATGAVNPFVNGLLDSGSEIEDSVFGPSSSGPGISLYIADGDAIQEVSGFAPVPEPTAFASLALGAATLAGFRRRGREAV